MRWPKGAPTCRFAASAEGPGLEGTVRETSTCNITVRAHPPTTWTTKPKLKGQSVRPLAMQHKAPQGPQHPPLRQTEPSTCEQSAPVQPSKHSQRRRLHTPCPEHWFRSSHWFMGCTVLDRHALQHCAGPTGTTWPSGLSLHSMQAAGAGHERARRPAQPRCGRLQR